METLNSAIAVLNRWGPAFCDLAGGMFLQSALLVGLLLLADRCLRRRVSAGFRYGLWLLVPVKLVLPPSLALPTGVAYWLGRHWPAASRVLPGPASAPPPAWAGHLAPLGDIPAPLPTAVPAPAAVSHLASLHWPGLVLLAWIPELSKAKCSSLCLS